MNLLGKKLESPSTGLQFDVISHKTTGVNFGSSASIDTYTIRCVSTHHRRFVYLESELENLVELGVFTVIGPPAPDFLLRPLLEYYRDEIDLDLHERIVVRRTYRRHRTNGLGIEASRVLAWELVSLL